MTGSRPPMHDHLPPGRKSVLRSQRAQAFACLALASVTAHAQSEAGGASARKQELVPTFSVSVTATDNVNLSATDRRADVITQISPGLHYSSNSGRIRGQLDYTVNAVVYANSSSSNEIQHALNGLATIEAVEDWAFVDVSGNVSQRAVSAFGTPISDNTSINPNRATVANYSISPYVRGRIDNLAQYDARLTYSKFTSGSAAATDAATTSAMVRLGGLGNARLGWSIEASQESFDQEPEGTVRNDRVRGVLSYRVLDELQLLLIGGRETHNVEGSEPLRQNTSGWGLNWTPNVRTRLSINTEKRFFGNSYSVNFEYRTPHTSWLYTDTRDLTTGFGQLRLRSLGTTYDLFFQLFASQIPDPVARAAFVNAFLLANNISPNALVLSGSLASTSLVQRSQQLGFAYSGLRDTLTATVSQTRGERAEQVVLVTDDFANGNQVTQRGITLGWAHRLTPSATLNSTLLAQNTHGSVDQRTSHLRTLLVTLTNTLTAKTTFSLSGRHTRGDSSANAAYTESALIATVSMTF